jgi:hypothetical protein
VLVGVSTYSLSLNNIFGQFALLVEPRVVPEDAGVFNPSLLSLAAGDMLDHPMLLFGAPASALTFTLK